MDKLEIGIKKEENEFERRLVDQRMSREEIAVQQNKLKAVIHNNLDELRRLGKVSGKARKVIAQTAKER